jgi:hypothetical protein
MAVGGLPSKRQGRLGRPKGHRHPHAMASFFVFFAISHSSLHLLPPSTSSPSSPAPPPAPSPSPPSPAPSPSPPSPAPSPPPPSPAPSPSPSPPPPTPSPTPSPSQSPSFFCLQHLVRLTPSQAFRSHPTGPGSIPAYPYKALPFWPSPPRPRHRPHPVFFKTNPERLEPQ